MAQPHSLSASPAAVDLAQHMALGRAKLEAPWLDRFFFGERFCNAGLLCKLSMRCPALHVRANLFVQAAAQGHTQALGELEQTQTP